MEQEITNITAIMAMATILDYKELMDYADNFDAKDRELINTRKRFAEILN